MDQLIRVGYDRASDRARSNALLGRLPTDEQERIRPHFEAVSLDIRSVLYSPEHEIDSVYFPLTGVLSLLVTDDSQTAIEVGSVGHEGLSGLSTVHGVDVSSQQCMVQVAGEALRIPKEAMRRALSVCPVLAERVRYANCFFNDVAQSVMCTPLHSARQRCARWLLTTHDRLHGEQLQVTHEFMSDLLAVRRSTVTVAMRGFAIAKIIEYTRGRLRILDRARLEAAACSCYRRRRSEHAAILAH